MIGAFPLTSPTRGPDWGSGFDYAPPIAVHQFDEPGLKTEQRFVLGSGARRFRIRRDHLSCQEFDALEAHWNQAQGTYATFPFYYHGPAGVETYNVRYENPNVSFSMLQGLLAGDPGLTLLEVPTTSASYTSVAQVTRFPDAAFSAALQQETQHMIPLVAIQDRGNNAPVFVSNQRVIIDGTLYLPRLVTWDGIKQSLGGASDSAKFTFGNADGVWTTLANTVNLNRAFVAFGLYHVESGYFCNLWAGYALPFLINPTGTFELAASDGAFQLGLGYPSRIITRTCWKVYKGRFCPSTSSLPDCPKDWDSCVARGVQTSFGGMVVEPAAVRIKDSSTGVLGWGRSSMTSVTVGNDSVYQRPLQEVWTDKALIVNCDVAAGRDEDQYYSALGIVSEGPIGAYYPNLSVQSLDGMPPHDPYNGGGWRGILGTDPAATSDFFQIDQGPNWGSPPADSTYAAGMAFAEIRRRDALGLQLAPVSDRAMKVWITEGIGGWVWTAPGARVWQDGIGNVVWVAINVYLRALGLRTDQSRAQSVTPAEMEAFFDVNQAIAAAAICDLQVDKLVGTGQEKQFPFRGILKERKPVKDWLQEILNCGLGFYTFVNGKLWIGIRENSSVLAGNAFTRATILYQSLQATPIQPQFNWLTIQFGDEEFGYELNNVTLYDIDAAGFLGTPESPTYTPMTMSLVGCSNKSQASRIAITRLREEVGGLGPTQQMNARALSFRTTVLALKTMVGDIISMTHAALPGGSAEGRVTSWALNPDFSIDIQASPTTDEMYAYDQGPKPADVPADPVPPEILPSIAGLAWMPNNVAPAANDPLYPDPLERTFALWQDYTIDRTGQWVPAVFVEGERPVNTYGSTDQARIAGAVLGSGGTLKGGQVIYAAVTRRDQTSGKFSFPSNLWAVWIDPALSNQKLSISLNAPPGGYGTVYDLWAGTDRRLIGWQQELPAATTNFDLTGPLHPMTLMMPNGAAAFVRTQAKHVWHSGVVGVLVTGTPAANQIQSNDFIGSAENWVGCYLTCIADFSDGSAPLWNFQATAFDPATGTFTISPTPTDPIGEGDVLIVRSVARSVSADNRTVTDSLWNNDVTRNQFPGTNGLTPGQEANRIQRILRGTGAGQYRYISDNTNTAVTVDPPWDIKPDATSIMIIEDATWAYTNDSSRGDETSANVNNSGGGDLVQIRMRIDNLRDVVALVAGFLVDSEGHQTWETVAVFREIYIFGQPPTVRIVGPAPLDPDGNTWQAFETDHTIRVDTSANDITFQLPPLYVYQGRTLVIWNDGAFTVTVEAYPGEALWDGSTSVILDTQGTCLKVTSA